MIFPNQVKMLNNGNQLKVYKNKYSNEYHKSIVKNDMIYSEEFDKTFANIYDWYNYIFNTNMKRKEIEELVYYTTENNVGVWLNIAFSNKIIN